MAIPKYKKQPVSAQVATEQFSGLPAEAEARGQAAISQEQNRMSAVQGQRANQELQSFSQRLNMFVGQAEGMMQVDAQMKAQKAGITDVAKRREEIAKIQKQHYNNPKVMQEKIDAVDEATREDNFSFYGRTYQNSVSTAYATQVEVDAMTAAAEAQALAKEDPRMFKAMYAPYRDQVVQGAPTDQASIAAQQAFDKHGSRIFSQMSMAKYAKDQAQLEENEVGNLDALSKMALDSASRGDTAGMNASLGQLEALAYSRFARGKIGEDERDFIINEARVGTQVNEFMRDVNIAASQGAGENAIMQFQNPNTKLGKRFAKLPEDAQEKVLARAEASAKKYRENVHAKDRQYIKDVETIQKTNLYDALDNITAGGKDMTADELWELEGEGKLSTAGVKTILDFQDTKTVPEVLTKFNDGAVLVNMSKDQILALPDISYTDKSKLISQRESALKDPLYDWTKSRYGKRALDYLAEDYNVPKDSVAMILAGINQEKTPAQQAYEDDRRELTKRIEAYPYDKQPEMAMVEYDKMKVERTVKNETADNDKAEQNLQDAIAEVKQISAESMDSMWTSDVTPLEAAKRKVEKKEMTNATYDRIKARLSGETSPPKKKHIKRTNQGTPTSTYKVPTNDYEARAAEWGYETPEITGKKVDVARVRSNVKKSAYPIMNKYGLTIKDGFRTAPGAGAKGSQHLHGNALDVEGWNTLSITQKQDIIREFKAAGFNGFGVGENTLHVDMRKHPASWSYYGATDQTGKGGIMPTWAAEAIGG